MWCRSGGTGDHRPFGHRKFGRRCFLSQFFDLAALLHAISYQSAIERMVAHYQLLLEGMVGNGHGSLDSCHRQSRQSPPTVPAVARALGQTARPARFLVFASRSSVSPLAAPHSTHVGNPFRKPVFFDLLDVDGWCLLIRSLALHDSAPMAFPDAPEGAGQAWHRFCCGGRHQLSNWISWRKQLCEREETISLFTLLGVGLGACGNDQALC